MSDITLHIDKTEKTLIDLKKGLIKELRNCENDLVSYEIRESLLKIERKEVKFNNLKKSLFEKYTKKEANSLKRLYKSIKIN